MGLDAVVYRSRDNLQLGADEKFARLIPDTGEVHFDDDDVSRRHDQEREAAHARLGNIAMISALRDEVGRLVGPQSLLYTKVLYDGTHSGDFIPITQLPDLLEEISRVRKASNQSRDLRDFLDSTEKLAQIALHERNPIVFV